MKLISFSLPSGLRDERRLGAVVDDAALDLTAATTARLTGRRLSADAARRVAHAITPPRIVEFIATGEVALEAATETVAWADGEFSHPLTAVRRLPAVVDAPLLRDFMAFEEHLRNYKGNPASVGADEDTIAIRHGRRPGGTGLRIQGRLARTGEQGTTLADHPGTDHTR